VSLTARILSVAPMVAEAAAGSALVAPYVMAGSARSVSLTARILSAAPMVAEAAVGSVMSG
jgi:hypothetical protein